MSVSYIYKKFEKIAFDNIYKCDSDEALSRFLIIWWCGYYKRPRKDPLLLEYTIEELLLEYFEQNLINNKKRFDELKQENVDKIKEITDEEWLKLIESEVGPTSEAKNNIELPKDISDDFTQLNKKD